MNKILISVEKDFMSFSKYNRNVNEENLNNTNVIDVKSLKFTEVYINENIDLVSTFINLILLKFKLNKVIIKNLEIAETTLKLLKNLSTVKYVGFKENKELTYTISSLLLENKNLEQIECFSLPEIMFYRFNKNIIKTRCEILSASNFLKINNINTYSELYNKDKIIIDEYLSQNDVNDMIYFFSNNINLKKIEFKRYSNQNLVTILKFLKQNGVKKVNIILWESELTTNELLKDVKHFEKLNKEYNVNIKIKYSKKYKDKNKVKELNILLFRNIVITFILAGLILLFISNLLERKDTKKVEQINEQINEVIENKETTNTKENESENKEPEYISSYYQNYNNKYEELVKINSDTVGWVKVNNTKINYPVVQTKDNDYYLSYAYDKTKNLAGWIYVDYRNNLDIIDQNTIIYGHSGLKGNIMFSSLNNVLNKNWYLNIDNRNIYFSIKGKEYIWKIFSIYTIKTTIDYLDINFISDNQYLEFINKIKNRSINNFEEEVGIEDKILTLSTCFKDDKSRLVVHAKLVK